MVRYSLTQVKKRAHRLIPLMKKIQRAGFSTRLTSKAETIDMAPLVDEFEKEFEESVRIGERFFDHKGGRMITALFGEDLTETRFSKDGEAWIRLLFLSTPAKDLFSKIGDKLQALKSTIVGIVTPAEYEHLADLAAGYLAGIDGWDYRFEITAGDRPFIKGRYEKPEMAIQILDPMVYLKLLLFALKGVEALKVSLKSSLHFLTLLDTAQDSIRIMAETLDDYEVRVCLYAGGKCVASFGKDVKPNTGTGFGPSALHLDRLFQIAYQGV